MVETGSGSARDGGGDPLLHALLGRIERREPDQPAATLDLRGIRAGRDDLLKRMPAAEAAPGWWDPRSRGLKAADLDLRDIRIEEGDFTGANFTRSSLAGVLGRSARFDEALLEDANFSQADLSGASFRRAVAGQVSFSDAMLEDANFSGAHMRFARLCAASLDGAVFEKADLWGAEFDRADADQTNFRDARLDEANLSETNLTHSDFSGASLKRAKLVGSRLRAANFLGAKLDGADLSGADLSGTNLVRLDLSTCKLRHVRLAGAWLSETRLRIEQFGGALGEEIAGDYAAAEESYLALERNLTSIGSKDEASWAYKKARRMGRTHSGACARAAWHAKDRSALVRHGYRWSEDRFVEWLCDYGESLSRIARAFVVLIALFALLYGLAGGLLGDGGQPTRNPIDLVSYSALNMLTSNPPDIGLKTVGRLTNILVGIEGALGIVLLGLFGFVLGNRLRR